MRLGLVRSLGMALVVVLAVNPMIAEAAGKKKAPPKKKPTAAAMAAYRAQGGALPAIVVLLDNYANYIEAAGENEALIGLIGRIAINAGAMPSDAR